MTLQTRLIDYHHDNLALEGYLAWDDGFPGPRPAVAVAHAWSGRSPFECAKADQLARLGYVGFALDMYGKGRLGTSVTENQALMSPLTSNRPLLQARMNLAIEILRQQPQVDPARVAAMGFCFGGLCALDLARSGSDALGVVSFHGLLTPPGNTGGNRITAKVLCLHGYDDPMAPPEAIDEFAGEMTSAGADWQLHAYGNTMHSFTNPTANDPGFGTVYSAAADRRSWQAMANFFSEIFAP